MAIFELVIALLFAGALLSSLARRLKAPYPALLAVAGAALALLPRTPSVTLDPQLALALFVAPVLLDAALDAEDGAREGMTGFLRQKYQTHLRRAESAAGGRELPDDGIPGYLASLRRAQAAERRALVDLRARDRIGDDAFHRVEEELDWAEMNAEAMARRD